MRERYLSLCRLRKGDASNLSLSKIHDLSIFSEYFLAMGMVWIFGMGSYLLAAWEFVGWPNRAMPLLIFLAGAVSVVMAIVCISSQIKAVSSGLRETRTGKMIAVSMDRSPVVIKGLKTFLGLGLRLIIPLLSVSIALAVFIFLLGVAQNAGLGDGCPLALSLAFLAATILTMFLVSLFQYLEELVFHSGTKLILDELKEYDCSDCKMMSDLGFLGEDAKALSSWINEFDITRRIGSRKGVKIGIPAQYRTLHYKKRKWDSVCLEEELEDRKVYVSIVRFPLSGVKDEEGKESVAVVFSDDPPKEDDSELAEWSKEYGMLVRVWTRISD